MRPDVWAPEATDVRVVLGDGSRHQLQPADDGWWVGGPPLGHGDRYGFSLDGSDPLPDPRSAWQPDGVHGLSAVDDPSRHEWDDDGWGGVQLLDVATYELHPGTFTRRGTLDEAIDRLDHLVDLGIGAVELLPVAEAMGERGWGYDGVDLYAVHHALGGPPALRRFVDAAHQRGLGVLLDVVYNHLGPEGAHLGRFGPYFTDRHHTPWGASVNLDGPGSDQVRRFVVEGALRWCRDFHVDGLRLDAVHALVDDRPVHVVAELTAAVHELGERDGRRRWVVIEREQPDPMPLLPRPDGWGVDARWGDDLHHALHVQLTGERDGYYADFGGLEPVRRALLDQHARRLVTCLQNHDQVGNRPRGERIAHLAGAPAQMAAAAVVLLGPGPPLLFQGEEWAADAPFPFFCDTEDAALADSIRAGRLEELRPLGFDERSFVDPLDPETAAEATLDWDELDRAPHDEVLRWYRRCLELRRSLDPDAPTSVELPGGDGLVLDRGALRLVVNLGEGALAVDLGTAEVLASTGTWTRSGDRADLGPWAALVLAGG